MRLPAPPAPPLEVGTSPSSVGVRCVDPRFPGRAAPRDPHM